MRIKIQLLLVLLLFGTMGCRGQEGSKEEEKAAGVYERLDNESFREKLAEDGVVVLDVRTPAEVERGTVEGAVAIDFTAPDFRERVAALDKDKTYLVYCQAGGRSAKACTMMREMGFSTLYEMKGGYGNWTP